MDSYTGKVQKGTKIAARLGFPTINIPLHDSDASGVYAAKVKVGEEEYEAVAFADQVRNILEAHLLDFSADLYGWNVTIELLKKIRDRKKFKDNIVPKKLLEKDIAAVRTYFRK
jgi:riboflavin kinase/FMN adenylyltransferase